MEELKDGRISYKDSPDLMYLMLDYMNQNPASFDKWKVNFPFPTHVTFMLVNNAAKVLDINACLLLSVCSTGHISGDIC